MAHLVLYDFPRSSNARKVRMAMAEKGIACEKAKVDLAAGAQRKPDYLKLNPHGKVPTMMIDGTPIYESTAIIEYLEETHPNPPLLPKDPVARARVRAIEEVIDSNFLGALRLLRINTMVRPAAERNEKEIEEGKRQIAWHNEWLDRELQGRQFLGGDLFSVADIAAFCQIGFQRALGVDIDPKFKNLSAWWARVDARPCSKA